jgi:hypothetical protein
MHWNQRQQILRMSRGDKLESKSENVFLVDSSRTGYGEKVVASSSKFALADALVYALIIAIGIFHFFSTVQAPDFSGDDVLFSDAGRALVSHSFYGINGYVETNLPPALSICLGLLCTIGACSRVIALRVIVVCGTAGFLVSYELLRRQMPRAIAAAICILLLSSQSYFLLASQLLNPSFPLFFTTMSALLVARKLETATGRRAQIGWIVVLTILVVLSLMLMSVAMALLGAIVACICGAIFRDRALVLHRVRIYGAVLLVGVVVQGYWMHRTTPEASAGIAAQEWPVEGFPHSYLAQLRLKSGNYPELGPATPKDFAVRILKHASEQTGALSEALLRQTMVLNSVSIFVLLPLLLVALGWTYSVWTTGGGLQDWYFAGYAFIYLAWPWNFEPRFAIAPLACFYVWRGGVVASRFVKKFPRPAGGLCLLAGLLLSACSWLWIHRSRVTRLTEELPAQSNVSLQDEISFVVWLLIAIAGAWLCWSGRDWFKPFKSFFAQQRTSEGRPVPVFPYLAFAAAGVLFVIGLVGQAQIARGNLDPSSEVNLPSADVLAGEWINSNTPENAVIMARHVPITFHYAKRKTIWFPPSSDPSLLMNGILKNRVDFLIVVHRKDSYYLPPDEECFDRLVAAHPDNFQLTYRGSDFRIFRVMRPAG